MSDKFYEMQAELLKKPMATVALCPCLGVHSKDVHLSLERTPKLLRVILNLDGVPCDALDQLDDVPGSDEVMVVYESAEVSMVHVCGSRNGRRFGETRKCVTYFPTANQPADEIMRDTEKWRQWCKDTVDAN